MRGIVVSDTNIFIDLFNAGLLERFCELPCSICTTDFVDMEIETRELRAEMERLYADGRIRKKTFKETEITGMLALQTRNLSFTDCSVLYYAKSGSYLLLTGDSKLRQTAEEMGLGVAGVIGIMDEMLSCGIIDGELYATSLTQLMATNPRLPKKEILQRLGKRE